MHIKCLCGQGELQRLPGREAWQCTACGTTLFFSAMRKLVNARAQQQAPPKTGISVMGQAVASLFKAWDGETTWEMQPSGAVYIDNVLVENEAEALAGLRAMLIRVREKAG